MRRVLICGDRNWYDVAMIRRRVAALAADDVVIVGRAAGADTIAEVVAKERGLTVFPFPADWRRYGRAAGPIRNLAMLNKGQPTEVWAFHDDLSQSKGTANMVKQARAKGLEVLVFGHDRTRWIPRATTNSDEGRSHDES